MAKIHYKKQDSSTTTRYFVMSVESMNDFEELLNFVSKTFNSIWNKRIDGPGTSIQKMTIKKEPIMFVISDTMGGQFFAENITGEQVAEEIALEVQKWD